MCTLAVDMRAARLIQDVRPGERLIELGDRQWTVREMDTHRVPGARAARCLICESTEVIRRFWEYPTDWRAQGDAELAEFCEGSAR